MDAFINMLRIRRVEFRIAELPILIIPVLLSIQDTDAVRTGTFWEGVLIFFFLFAFGDMVNCLADRDLDAIYKKHLSNAVYGLGLLSVKRQIAFSVLAVLALTVHLAWLLDRWLLPALVVVGLGLGAAYSVEPVRLKRRGIAGALCLWLIIFVGPMMLAAMLVTPFPSLPVLALAETYGMLQMGVTLVNTAEDYPEDLEAGLNTSIIQLGLVRGIRLAGTLAAVGAAGTLLLLGTLLWRADGFGPWLLGLLPALFATAFVSVSIRRLHARIALLPLDKAVVQVKQTAKQVPIWFTVNAWSVCLAAFCMYKARAG